MLQLAHGVVDGSVRFHTHLDVWLILGGVCVTYLALLRWWVSPEEHKVSATGMQKLAFFGGMGVLWVGADWPIHDLAENYLFSVHMFQHTLFSLVAPPLLLLGLSAPLLRKLLAPVMPLVRFATKPLIAFALFNVVLLFTHWPVIVNYAVTHELGHFLLHCLLVFSSLVMWWVVVSPLPELGVMQPMGKMLFLLGQSFLPTVPASFLTFATTPIYSAYAHAPRLWGISAVTDQMIAGLMMKIGGGLILWSVIGLIFFKWYAKEQRDQHEEIGWEDFERELQVWDLRK
jgi:putative membrane protein